MTPHGQHSASRLDPPPTHPAPVVPAVTPSSEVNAIGQPLQAQQTTSAAVVTEAAQRLQVQQATPAVTTAGAEPRGRAAPGSSGGVSEAELVTPPGGFQHGQVWLNNVFSPEMPERPRCVGRPMTMQQLNLLFYSQEKQHDLIQTGQYCQSLSIATLSAPKFHTYRHRFLRSTTFENGHQQICLLLSSSTTMTAVYAIDAVSCKLTGIRLDSRAISSAVMLLKVCCKVPQSPAVNGINIYAFTCTLNQVTST